MAWCNLQGVSINLVTQDEDGGLDLTDVAAKCRALFLTRFWAQGERDGSLTAKWLNVWAFLSPRTNPPHIREIPRTLEYLRIYFHDWAIMEPQRQAETLREFKRRVYNTLQTMSTTENKPREVCIMQLQPAIHWSLLWGSLHNVRLAVGATSAWRVVFHDIIPTNARLHRIRLMDTDNCTQRGRQDIMLHRLTECGVGQEIWEWTRTQTARIRRTDPRRVPTEWLLRPCFQLWPRR